VTYINLPLIVAFSDTCGKTPPVSFAAIPPLGGRFFRIPLSEGDVTIVTGGVAVNSIDGLLAYDNG
jgi:hypothetical protein